MNGHSRPRPSKAKGTRWTAVVYVDAEHGGPRTEQHGTFDRKTDADAKWQEVVAEYRRGERLASPETMTLRDAYTVWMRDGVRPDRAQNTVRDHEMNFTRHILGVALEDRGCAFGDLVASEVTKADVAAWQAAQLGAGCAVKSVRNYRGSLHRCLSWHVSLGNLRSNPVRDVPAPRQRRRKPDCPSVDAMRAFVDAVAHTRLWPGLLMAAGSAMRRGEFLAVRWCAVELVAVHSDDGVIYQGGATVDPVRGNLTGTCRDDLRFGPPKTEAGARFVPFAPFTVRGLLELRARRRVEAQNAGVAWDDEALVCCGGDGQAIVPDDFTHALWRFRTRHDLPRLTPHSFRHGVIEALLAAGERPDVVQEIAGHANLSTTMAYANAADTSHRAAMQRYGQGWETEKSDLAQTSRGQSEVISGSVTSLVERRRRKTPA